MIYENLIVIAAMGIGLGLLGAKLMYIFVTYSFSDLAKIIASGNFGAIIRVIVELFRYDAARGILWGISTSQFISMAMFAAAVILFIARKNKNKTPEEKKI